MTDEEQAAIDALLAAGKPNEARAVELLRARLSAMVEQFQAGQRFSYERGRADERERYMRMASIGCKPDAGELLQVLRMVDDNNRVDDGEDRRAWRGDFVAAEVRRVLGNA